MPVKALVLLAAGINCDGETAYALEQAGADVERVHVLDLVKMKNGLDPYHMLVIPGGFSYGDDIASGKVLATLLRHQLEEQILHFISQGKLILGVCNGFQVLVKAGLLPGGEESGWKQNCTLTFNDSGKFEDRWVPLRFDTNSPCVFTKEMGDAYFPVRHGEGKFVTEAGTLDYLLNNGMVPVFYGRRNSEPEYPDNPNGSQKNIAGICDRSGRVFGLMPHPEAFIRNTQHPRWTRETLPSEGAGLKIFRNGVQFIRDNLL